MFPYPTCCEVRRKFTESERQSLSEPCWEDVISSEGGGPAAAFELTLTGETSLLGVTSEEGVPRVNE